MRLREGEPAVQGPQRRVEQESDRSASSAHALSYSAVAALVREAPGPERSENQCLKGLFFWKLGWAGGRGGTVLAGGQRLGPRPWSKGSPGRSRAVREVVSDLPDSRERAPAPSPGQSPASPRLPAAHPSPEASVGRALGVSRHSGGAPPSCRGQPPDPGGRQHRAACGPDCAGQAPLLDRPPAADD